MNKHTLANLLIVLLLAACTSSTQNYKTNIYKTIHSQMIDTDTLHRSVPVPNTGNLDTVLDHALFMDVFPRFDCEYELRIYQNFVDGILLFTVYRQNFEWHGFAARLGTKLNEAHDSLKLNPQNVALIEPSGGWKVIADSARLLGLDKLSKEMILGVAGGPTDGDVVQLQINAYGRRGYMNLYAPDYIRGVPEVKWLLRLMKYLRSEIGLPTPALRDQ